MEQNGHDVQLADTADGTTKPKRGTVTRNPVIVAISKISGILDDFDEATQDRILGFVNEQYGK